MKSNMPFSAPSTQSKTATSSSSLTSDPTHVQQALPLPPPSHKFNDEGEIETYQGSDLPDYVWTWLKKYGMKPIDNRFIISPFSQMIGMWVFIPLFAAQRILDEFNTKNRSLYQVAGKVYSRAMRNKEWQEHHQGLCFDKNGVVVDGQTRLFALVDSGKPTTMLVFFGADPDVRLVVDKIRKRTDSDTLTLMGVSNANAKALQVYRAVLNKGVSKSMMNMGLTDHEHKCLYQYLSPVVQEILDLAPKGKTKTQPSFSSSVLAVLVRSLHGGHATKDQIDRFAMLLKNPSITHPADRFPVYLYNVLMKMRSDAAIYGYSNAKRKIHYHLTAWCLKGFVDGGSFDREPNFDKVIEQPELFPIDVDVSEHRQFIIRELTTSSDNLV